MKFTDDYNAKYRIWAKESKVYSLPKVIGLPRFRSRKFSSYREFNEWKRELLKEIAAQGGVRWTN